MIDFKGSHYPKDVILYAVFFYVRYAVSYRDLEEIMAERGIEVVHMIRKRQFETNGQSAFQQFSSLAA